MPFAKKTRPILLFILFKLNMVSDKTQKWKISLTWLIICNLSNTPAIVSFLRKREDQKSFHPMTKPCCWKNLSAPYSFAIQSEGAFPVSDLILILNDNSPVHFQSEKLFQTRFSGLRFVNTECLSSAGWKKNQMLKIFTENRINYNLVCLHSIKSFLCANDLSSRRSKTTKQIAYSILIISHFLA